jgi:hypothetical protein
MLPSPSNISTFAVVVRFRASKAQSRAKMLLGSHSAGESAAGNVCRMADQRPACANASTLTAASPGNSTSDVAKNLWAACSTELLPCADK